MRTIASAAVVFVVSAASAVAQPSFWSILPPGNDGHVPSGTTQPGPHAGDQLDKYAALIRDAPGIGDELSAYFKDAAIAPPAAPERTTTPRPGGGPLPRAAPT